MQSAARVIVEEHAGKFPEKLSELLDLPGIGRYTAGAICSIAFNQPTPILDGNVIRVLTRCFGIEGDPRSRDVNAALWLLSESLVKTASRLAHTGANPTRRNCSDLNQALMELGAVVCTPRNPSCKECPLRSKCVALQTDRVTALPELAERARQTARWFAAFVLWDSGKVLLRQRPAGAVNAFLWEFPNVELASEDASPGAAAVGLLGCTERDLKPLCKVQHTITRYRIRLQAFEVQKKEGVTVPDGRWLTLGQMEKLAFPSAHRKILNALRMRLQDKFQSIKL